MIRAGQCAIWLWRQVIGSSVKKYCCRLRPCIHLIGRTYQDNEEFLDSIDEAVISMGGKVLFLS